MRIAYIAPYQGPELLHRRPILLNLGLAANVKMELISELLLSKGHEIELISQGEVVEHAFRYLGAFSEPKVFHRDIPVEYSSSVPVRFLNGFWSNRRTLGLFKRRHRARPFDIVIIYNLKGPQVACALHARKLGIPIVVEYEDDAFVDVLGRAEVGPVTRARLQTAAAVLRMADGFIGVSPLLMSRFPSGIPGVMLRGVVDLDVMRGATVPVDERRNWVVYSGTHVRSKGLEPLVAAWKSIRIPGWELHIAGRGELTERLEALAADRPDIVFHGLLDRKQNAAFLAQGKIGINPHELSSTPGNVFAFKIIEYLAAGNHVITTPMGELEPEIEAGLTYIPDNEVGSIANAIRTAVMSGEFTRTAAGAAHAAYGPEAVAARLDELVRKCAARSH